MPNVSFRRLIRIALGLLCFFCILKIYRSSDARIGIPRKYASTKRTPYDETMLKIQEVVSDFFDMDPGITKIPSGPRNMINDGNAFNDHELAATNEILSMYSQVTTQDIQAMHSSHALALEKVMSATLNPHAFKGRGIAIVGGGKYFPVALTTISWIREKDQDTPIEIFMLDETEYEPSYCEGLFPSINVRCKILTDIYGDELTNKIKSMYALKPLAMLASSFEDLLFLDSDSIPLTDIHEIFKWDIFQQKGLIINSDYWRRTVHPAFFEIAGIKLGGRVRGNPESKILEQVDREGSIPNISNESGQMFIKKSNHFKTLLLTTYYNLYGPGLYFQLLMQGNFGEGDKDTFAAAAVVIKEEYFQTSSKPVSISYSRDGDGQIAVMVQPNPIDSYHKEVEGKDIQVRSFAFHINGLKGNPRVLMENPDGVGFPPLKKTRYFGSVPLAINIDKTMDPELDLFKAMQNVACNWAVENHYIPKDWSESDPNKICTVLNSHVEWLAANPTEKFNYHSPVWAE